MRSRWEKLLDSKPIPIAEHLLDELAKLLAAELRQWPPALEEADPRLAAVLAPDAPPPTAVHLEEAFKLARLELRRELEAVDDYYRNQRFLERGLPPSDRPLLLFLTRWVVEQLLAIGELTDGRVNRARMVECLDRAERVLRQGAT